MVNLKKVMIISSLFLSHTALADMVAKDLVIKPEVEKSLSTYKVCNTEKLAQELAKKFHVFDMKDPLAKYNYYLIKNNLAMNVDIVRRQTCEFIVKNNCYIFWGNVANIAMIAEQKAAWFPVDTSPHYMLSPIITCNKHHTPLNN